MRLVKFVKQIRFPRKKINEFDDCYISQHIEIELSTISSSDISLQAINYLEKKIKEIEEVWSE